jgi:hypothetical protein
MGEGYLKYIPGGDDLENFPKVVTTPSSSGSTK